MAKWLAAATAAGGEGGGVENISSLISSAIFQVLTPMCIEKANDLIAVSRSQVTQAGSEERGGEGGSGNRRGGVGGAERTHAGPLQGEVEGGE
jgi:hypothetical protein